MAKKRRFQAISVSSKKVCKSRKLTSKILKVASEQQREIEKEETLEKFPISSFFKQAEAVLDDFNYDVDETHSQDMGSDDDMMSEKEERLLLDEFFEKDGNSIAQRISDAVTSINKDDTVTVSLVSKSEALAFLQSLGKFMSVFTHGKMPKAFNYIASLENWDSLLNLTQPENWSPRAMLKATKIFASTAKPRFFYQHFLLPRVRKDIGKHKKLHFSIYKSLKKALFKPDCFYCGILIPLCKSGTCTNSEAVIIASIMQKMSIPENISRDALVRLAEMTFRNTTSFFMKVILEKKYSLAYTAIDAVTSHFLRFHREAKVMPVIWHQTLFAFVQLYKHELSKEDKKCLRSLLEIQNHQLITPHIVKELDNSINRGEKLIVSPYNKPVKEELFDMPEVPMEEDY